MVLLIRANTFQEGEIDYLAFGSQQVPAVRFTQDADTGMYRPAPNSLAFSTGGKTAMHIDPSGNVDIVGFVTANGLVRSMTVTSVTGTVAENSSADCVVSGSGFDGPMLVTVGGTSAIATSRIDDTTLQVTVPPKLAGTYDLSVIRRADGAMVTLPSGLTYHDQAIEFVPATDLGNVQLNTLFSIPITAVSSNPTIEYANVTTLPPGCTINTSTGEFTGTITGPTSDTQYSFTIQATDTTTSQTTTQPFLLHATLP